MGDKDPSPIAIISALSEATKGSSDDNNGSAPKSDLNLVDSNLNTETLGSGPKR